MTFFPKTTVEVTLLSLWDRSDFEKQPKAMAAKLGRIKWVITLVIYHCVTKLPSNLVAYHSNKHVIFHAVYVGQGSGSSSGEGIWLSISHEVRVKLSGRAALVRGPDWVWWNHFQGGALT